MDSKTKRTAMLFFVFVQIILSIFFLTTPAYSAIVRASAVDRWLITHPEVADAMIWEFPPEKKFKPIPQKPDLWVDAGIFPGPEPLIPFYSFLLQPVAREPGLPGTPEVGLDFPSFREADTNLPEVTQESVLPAALIKQRALQDPVAEISQQSPKYLPGGIKKSKYGAEIRAWAKWPEWAKEELRARYADYTIWAMNACELYTQYAATEFSTKPAGFDDAFSSLVNYDPAPISDPPVNLQPDDPAIDGIPYNTLHSSTAFALYVRLVAMQLVLETRDTCISWSLDEYNQDDVNLLFDGRISFQYIPVGTYDWGEMTSTGHVVRSTVLPAPPLIVLGFLGQNGLIGIDRYDTLLRLLEWERNMLDHTKGGTPVTEDGQGGYIPVALGYGVNYFGYNGRAPLSRIINGTHMQYPQQQSNYTPFFDPELRHWVGGCGSTTGFTQQVLKILNISVEQTVFAHYQNRFAIGGDTYLGIGHGDDPYSLRYSKAPEIPTWELLFDDATFQYWFVNESDYSVQAKNVGRNVADLFIEYLPLGLMQRYCRDRETGATHETGLVYNSVFPSTYSVQELEAFGLWTEIEAKLSNNYGSIEEGCTTIGTTYF